MCGKKADSVKHTTEVSSSLLVIRCLASPLAWDLA